MFDIADILLLEWFLFQDFFFNRKLGQLESMEMCYENASVSARHYVNRVLYSTQNQ